MIKISVIIPCYNVARYIDRCMASVVAQTIGMDSLEVICIDDASTDDTWMHLQVWEELFSDNVLLIRQEVNRRQGTARNIGLRYASADWIAFLDADDWLEPDYFEQLYRPATQYGFDVVCCEEKGDASESLTYFDADSRSNGKNTDSYVVVDTEEKRRALIINKSMGEGVCRKLIRKSLIFDAHMIFPEDLAYEDMYWMPLLHVYANSIYFVGKRMYHCYINNASTSRCKNSDHHIDFITVQLMKWKEYDYKYGLLKKYPKELELDALRDAVLFLELFVKWYDYPSFSFFQLEKEVIQQHVPEYKGNPYLKWSKGLEFFLDALYRPMDKNEFQRFVNEARKYQ